ncbi:MAG TPA: hypothetical protein VIL44_07705 [Micromonospora sp.]
MRDLDEALARLARRDKLQKRYASGECDRARNAVDDVIETLRRLVERHHNLSVVARLDTDDASTEIRVEREAGTIRVDRKEVLSGAVLPPVNQRRSTADDPLFGPPPSFDALGESETYLSGRSDDADLTADMAYSPTDVDTDPAPRSEPTVIDIPINLSDSSPLLDDGPVAGQPFGGQTSIPDAYDAGSSFVHGDRPFLADSFSPSFPSSSPPEWPPRTEATRNSAEARLLDLIRRDPSLLEGTSDR